MTRPDRKTLEAAASWYVQFQSQSPTSEQHQAWQQWLNRDPSHQAAWNQMEQLQRSLGGRGGKPHRAALRRMQEQMEALAAYPALGSSQVLGGWVVGYIV